jgi:creatinine amidohydrolase
MTVRKYALADMTSVEFRERIPEGPVILLPLGSQEVQGPQGPMGDFMLSELLARQAAEAADAIAAPTIPFGYADVFRPVAGGIQLRPSTFSALLEDVVTSLLDHGLERIVLFNGHTGNAGLIDQTVRRLRMERGILVPSINIWKVVPTDLWRHLHGPGGEAVSGHGADPIASVYLHLLPHLVRADLIAQPQPKRAFALPTAGPSTVLFEGLPVAVPLGIFESDPSGLIGGDASRASADVGATLAAHIVGFTARFLRHFRLCDPRSPATEPT